MEGEGDMVRVKVGGDEGRMELRLKVRRWRVNRRQDTRAPIFWLRKRESVGHYGRF